ncbi:hypothetical protein KPH14_007455 [Odynerus spinipes]|uniref:Activin types I and II receptor domain-containing protein n=1 Tax=Odynerus spinipes TaxID=1348599 RepID=A0AAD9VIR2_9HYME|nr:hypothetical protein KPH14_007455 [Odynerus spinipes]
MTRLWIIYGRFVALIFVGLTISPVRVDGIKCVCTSKACKEAGEDTCETKYFCYTELILSTGQEFGEHMITQGCTQSATPLLCETKSWVSRSKPSSSSTNNNDEDEEDGIVERVSSTRPWIQMPWPRLKCCDNEDYCNADRLLDLSMWMREREAEEEKDKRRKFEKEEEEGRPSIRRMNQVSRGSIDSSGPSSNSAASRDRILSIPSDTASTIDQDRGSDRLLQHRVRPLHVAAFVLAIAALISVLAACYVITRFLKSNPYVAGSVE